MPHRYVTDRETDATRAVDAWADCRVMQVAGHPHDALLGRVRELRANCTAYDAGYIALSSPDFFYVGACD